jgi:hypothetical protein
MPSSSNPSSSPKVLPASNVGTSSSFHTPKTSIVSRTPNPAAPGSTSPDVNGDNLPNGLGIRPSITGVTNLSSSEKNADLLPDELSKLRAVRELMKVKGEVALMKFLQS